MTKSPFIPNFFKFYNILWKAALPFLKRNKRLAPTFDKRVLTHHLAPAHLWIQAASAGESYLALSILGKLSPARAIKVLVTTTTDQGLEILENAIKNQAFHPNVQVTLEVFPFDMPRTVDAAVKAVNPKVMVLLETEIWPAFFWALKKNKSKILILNARLSKKSGRHYYLTRKIWRSICPDKILAISPGDQSRYQKVFHQTPVELMHNIKFDLMEERLPPNEVPNPLDDFFQANLPLSILASVRRQEEDRIMELIPALFKGKPEQIIALFPRHMHRIPKIQRQLKTRQIDFVLRSELQGPVKTPCVILWDVFGELKSAYGFASSVFVGGSLVPLGGQNFMEPAGAGSPTVIGPYWDDFFWVGEDIFTRKLVTRARDVQTVARTMLSHLESPGDRKDNQQKIHAFIQTCQGGTQTACQAIETEMAL